MTTTSLQIPRTYLAAASLFASHDDTRPNICGVWLTSDEGKLVVMATDGRRMLILRTDKKAPENDIFIPNLLKAAVIRGSDSKNILVWCKDGRTIVDTFGLTISEHTGCSILPWKHIVPDPFPDECKFTWANMHYLYDLWTASEMLGMDDGAVKIHAESESQPMVAWTPKKKTPQLTMILAQMRLAE